MRLDPWVAYLPFLDLKSKALNLLFQLPLALLRFFDIFLEFRFKLLARCLEIVQLVL